MTGQILILKESIYDRISLAATFLACVFLSWFFYLFSSHGLYWGYIVSFIFGIMSILSFGVIFWGKFYVTLDTLGFTIYKPFRKPAFYEWKSIDHFSFQIPFRNNQIYVGWIAKGSTSPNRSLVHGQCDDSFKSNFGKNKSEVLELLELWRKQNS